MIYENRFKGRIKTVCLPSFCLACGELRPAEIMLHKNLGTVQTSWKQLRWSSLKSLLGTRNMVLHLEAGF